MQKNKLLLVLRIAGAASLLGTAEAQVAGSTTAGVSPSELTQVALGWSVKRSILDKAVYSSEGEMAVFMGAFRKCKNGALATQNLRKDECSRRRAARAPPGRASEGSDSNAAE